ncbi:MAG: protein-glutamate O-methyltransferase CheR [Candidatus Hydrogenedentes bacterium]|nr:protein-glutamate O-methyltransferase CheR [Candidatus Hydrogenedentota bacterium]
MRDKVLRDLEVELLLEGIQRRYGHDFRHYARASLNRRVGNLVLKMGLKHVSELIPLVLRDERVFNDFLREMSVTVTEMFRDPQFYRVLKDEVLPYLATYPLIRIWHAGCATGEEVYSVAIVLKQAGLYNRAQIYATDFNNESLDHAKAGVYELDRLAKFSANYEGTLPVESLSEYYVTNDTSVKMLDSLKQHITFANHNLVTDGVFGEMNLIICRNVLIYFDRELQDRVLRLFLDSLGYRGFLCLGSKESLGFSGVGEYFEPVSRSERVFRRLRHESQFALAGGARHD